MALLRKWLVGLLRNADRLVVELSIWLARAARGGPKARSNAIRAAHKAWQEADKQRWNQAILLSRAAIAADPSYSEGYLMLGFARMKSGDTGGAREAFEQGSRLDPSRAEFAAYLGETEFGLKRWAEAEGHYRRALLLDPCQPGWLLYLAIAVEAQGRWEEAEKLLEKARELDWGHVRVLTTLGAVRLHLNNLTGAEQALREAISKDPSFASAHYYLAATLGEMERWDEALVEAQRAVDLGIMITDPSFGKFIEIVKSYLQEDE